MNSVSSYNGGLTAEQFLFYEIRIVARFYLDATPLEKAIELIKADNLFQYPTERLVSRLTRTCYRRIDALGNALLRREIASASVNVAKQINLYAMMRYNRLVYEFMTGVVGEKYICQDFSFSRQDLNAFFSRLQEQDDSVAAWSDSTIAKIKQVLVKSLVETEYLDTTKSETLNPVFLCPELEAGIRENNDKKALTAFNCLRQELGDE